MPHPAQRLRRSILGAFGASNFAPSALNFGFPIVVNLRNDHWCNLVLLINRKSHIPMGYRLVPKLIILNDLERFNARPLLRVITLKALAFKANYVKLVEGRPVLSATKT